MSSFSASHWIILGLILSMYFLPWIIAAKRNHKNKASIAMLNIFLGWTFVGWMVALIWAFMSSEKLIYIADYKEKFEVNNVEYEDYIKCPYCAEPIRKEAIKCRHCSSFLVTKNPE